jgi:hypothetical protein
MITSALMNALQNLAEKKAGVAVDWINISDARALTELGLAQRSREGWEITGRGVSLIKDGELAGEQPAPVSTIVPFPLGRRIH